MTGAPQWRIEDGGSAVVARCLALDACDGIRHAFSTASGAGGPLDAGPALPDGAALAARASIARSAGIEPGRLRALRQVHGDVLVDARDADPANPPEADGVWALRGAGGLAPAVRTADCAPVLLADRAGRAVAAVHAGWRGAAAGILQRAVERLAALGIAEAGLIAAIGPAAGSCCYEVQDEVLAAVARGVRADPAAIGSPGSRAGHPYLDLPGAVAAALRAARIPLAAIHRAPWCTICSAGRFHSFRRDGAAAGRALSVVGWESGLLDGPATMVHNPRFPA